MVEVLLLCVKMNVLKKNHIKTENYLPSLPISDIRSKLYAHFGNTGTYHETQFSLLQTLLKCDFPKQNHPRQDHSWRTHQITACHILDFMDDVSLETSGLDQSRAPTKRRSGRPLLDWRLMSWNPITSIQRWPPKNCSSTRTQLRPQGMSAVAPTWILTVSLQLYSASESTCIGDVGVSILVYFYTSIA